MDNLPKPEELQELILIATERLSLKQPYIVEKDFYVTHVLQLLSNVKNEHCGLIFGGGTSCVLLRIVNSQYY